MGLVLLVRHGQASFGADDYDVLSESGVTQARRLGDALAEQAGEPAHLVHGSMRRQRDTAAALADAAGWQLPPRTDARWDEFDHLAVLAAHGPATPGLDRRAFQQAFEKATSRWTAASGTSDPDDAASFRAFVARAAAAMRDVAASVGSGETAVVVTSGGVIAVVCALLTLGSGPTPAGAAVEPDQLPAVWQRLNAVLVNASVTRVLVGSTGVRMLTFNEHGHLPRAEVTYR